MPRSKQESIEALEAIYEGKFEDCEEARSLFESITVDLANFMDSVDLHDFVEFTLNERT